MTCNPYSCGKPCSSAPLSTNESKARLFSSVAVLTLFSVSLFSGILYFLFIHYTSGIYLGQIVPSSIALIFFLAFPLSVALLLLINAKVNCSKKCDLDIESQRLEMALKNVQDGVWDWSIASGECYYSPVYRELLGYTTEEFPDQVTAWQNILHPHDRLAARNALELHNNTNTPYFVEYRLKTKTEQYKWFEAKADSVRDYQGNPVRMIGSIRDISQRKSMENVLQQELGYIEYILKRNPALIVCFAPNGKILKANPKASKVSGYTQDELIGYNWYAVFCTKEKYEDLRQETNGDPIEFSSLELEMCTKENEPKIINWTTLNRYNENVEVCEIIAVGIDVTDQVAFKKQLIAAKEDAENANSAKSDFLANMSHEIRTPMNGIIGTASLMAETKLDQKQNKYLSIIQNSGRTLLNILNEILDYSKIEAGKFEIHNDIFDLQKSVEEQISLLQPLADEKGLGFTLDYQDSLPPCIIGDETRVKQLLTNLVGNAIKFTDTGKISVSVSSNAETPYRIKFFVTDSGIGIPKDKQMHVFGAFEQIAATGKKMSKTPGTGLGLAISKYLAEMMGGSIGVQSEEGKGSTFWFEIKAGKPTKQQIEDFNKSAVPKQKEDYEGFHKHILLVEDVITNQFVMTDMLEGLQCTVDIAGNGEEALRMVQEKAYDLIFMDCQMPVMDGFEATREIRRLEIADLPIIALTANAMKSDQEKCFKAGMSDFVSKPVNKQDIVDVLSRWNKQEKGK